MRKVLLICVLTLCTPFFLSCKSLSENSVAIQTASNTIAFSRYANELVSLIRVLYGPDEQKILVKAKDNDPTVRILENTFVKRLQIEGYAVAHVLPDNEMQKEKNKIMQDGVEVHLDLIPYQGSSYTEISLELNGERYSKLFSTKLRDPAPVSHWIKRGAE